MSTAQSTDAVHAALDAQQVWQEELYRHFHANPELSMQESATVARITAELDSLGFRTRQIGGGVVGELVNGEGPVVAFRADVDALPVEEDPQVPHRSSVRMVDLEGIEQPVMHACGHDMHIACALGAARVLADHPELWAGTLLVIFQPGEETAAGARSMVADGLVERVPRPEVVFAQHVLPTPASGEVAVAAGAVLSTAVSLTVTLFGTGTHGSMPHLGVDPVVLAASVVSRLQGIVSRELAPGTFGVVTVGSLQAGTKANIIADRAVLRINVRAYSDEVRTQLVDAITRIVLAESQASRSPAEPVIELVDPYPLTVNDERTTRRVREALVAGLGAERVQTFAPATASEDFSLLPDAWQVPYCYWGFGGFAEGRTPVGNHNPGFVPDLQPTLRTGTQAAALVLLEWLGQGR